MKRACNRCTLNPCYSQKINAIDHVAVVVGGRVGWVVHGDRLLLLFVSSDAALGFVFVCGMLFTFSLPFEFTAARRLA